MEFRSDKIKPKAERQTQNEIAGMLDKLALIFLWQNPDAPDRCFEAVEADEKNRTTN